MPVSAWAAPSRPPGVRRLCGFIRDSPVAADQIAHSAANRAKNPGFDPVRDGNKSVLNRCYPDADLEREWDQWPPITTHPV